MAVNETSTFNNKLFFIYHEFQMIWWNLQYLRDGEEIERLIFFPQEMTTVYLKMRSCDIAYFL